MGHCCGNRPNEGAALCTHTGTLEEDPLSATSCFWAVLFEDEITALSHHLAHDRDGSGCIFDHNLMIAFCVEPLLSASTRGTFLLP